MILSQIIVSYKSKINDNNLGINLAIKESIA